MFIYCKISFVEMWLGSYRRMDNIEMDTKRFYTRGTLRGIRISRLAKIHTLYRDNIR